MFYDFITKYTDIFFWNNEISFCTAKASNIFFNKKYWHIWDINVWNFNASLTNDVASFEQPGPDCAVTAASLSLYTEAICLLLLRISHRNRSLSTSCSTKTQTSLQFYINNQCHCYKKKEYFHSLNPK